MKRLFDGDTFEHKGHTFRFRCEIDQDMIEPWKEHDGHGEISEWTNRDKAPGERILAQDRRSYRYYDIQETIKVAHKDGWGCRMDLEANLGRKPTKKEIAAQAVNEDFEHMRSWCEDKWHWCGIIVTMIKDSFGNTPEQEIEVSVWGIDGDDQTEYLSQEAYELADECIGQWQEYGAKVNM